MEPECTTSRSVAVAMQRGADSSSVLRAGLRGRPGPRCVGRENNVPVLGSSRANNGTASTAQTTHLPPRRRGITGSVPATRRAWIADRKRKGQPRRVSAWVRGTHAPTMASVAAATAVALEASDIEATSCVQKTAPIQKVSSQRWDADLKMSSVTRRAWPSASRWPAMYHAGGARPTAARNPNQNFAKWLNCLQRFAYRCAVVLDSTHVRTDKKSASANDIQPNRALTTFAQRSGSLDRACIPRRLS